MKRAFVLVVALVMSMGLLTSCTPDFECEENDFRLTMLVDKEEASPGDTVMVTVILENLSGKNITMRLSPWATRERHEIEDLISIVAYTNIGDCLFLEPSLGGIMGKKVIKKDGVYRREEVITINEYKDYGISAAIFIHLWKGLPDVSVFADTITVKVNLKSAC